jgi:hypothetical protein
MKKLKLFSIIALAGFCFLVGPAPASAEDEALVSLMDKISQRINSYPENNNYKAKVLTKVIEMNKQWEPKKTTIIKAITKSRHGDEESEILEATETENGKTSDVTEKVAEQAEKQKEKARHDAEKKQGGKETRNPLDDFFPFDETKRSGFDFRKLDNAVVDGRDVYVIESDAKTKDENRFEGKYYIDQRTLDILKIDVKPSENPLFVKEIRMEIDFEILPEGNFVMKKMTVKAVAKLVFKTIRQVTETEYYDYEILHPGTG